MKTNILILSGLAFFLTLSSFSIGKIAPTAERIQFSVRGNGKGYVKLGFGAEVGSGPRYTVSKDGTVYVTGEVGHLLYDVDTEKVILTAKREMSGKTVDLRKFY
ncbi:MAG: hypothetical protein ACK5CL_05700 [Sphingomonadales bacterium]|jgi:hypothetical protein